MNICLFTPEEISKPLSIRDPRGQHLLKILHKAEGDSFSAGIIDGPAGNAVITSINVQETASSDGRKTWEEGTISFDFTPQSDGKPLYPLIMIIGFPRPIQLKRLMRDLAGLGCCEIHLTGTELGEKSYLKSDLATSDAGYEMLLEGTVQAASTHVPKLYKHETLKECLDFVEKELQENSRAYDQSADKSATGKYALDNIRADGSLYKSLNEKEAGFIKQAAAAIGSERGWTENERTLLEQYGYKRLSMGQRVLRTESASTVAATLILAAMDKLN